MVLISEAIFPGSQSRVVSTYNRCGPRNRIIFSRTFCSKSRPLFVDTLAFWRKEPADKHYGVFICPDYKYDPVKRVWIRTDEAYACGEQARELFFAQGGKTFYAGTYMCHTGPAHLRVHHLGALGNEVRDALHLYTFARVSS
ncbi:hypothetical protein LXA43DRAFT_1038781 [Ganoderma leucocontextum]|nr:hypothetical protein LXA43DRAFT_1042112 [Ganoderma leucocontextum]KAI1785263.1 hypothetical protein LXA43DRAFT_1038781 [Ganoderma leucocontextum]